MDEEMNFDGFLSSIDTIFYGRVSYDMWGNFQPDSTTSEAEKSLWEVVHSKQKFVFSRSAKEDGRANFVHSDISDQVARIKKQEGRNIWLYGGASLIKTFIQLGLIDTYRLSVHPTVLGSGKPLFEELTERLELNLIEVNRFKSGVVQLVYNRKKDKRER